MKFANFRCANEWRSGKLDDRLVRGLCSLDGYLQARGAHEIVVTSIHRQDPGSEHSKWRAVDFRLLNPDSHEWLYTVQELIDMENFWIEDLRLWRLDRMSSGRQKRGFYPHRGTEYHVHVSCDEV